jgi:hypothetical protein
VGRRAVAGRYRGRDPDDYLDVIGERLDAPELDRLLQAGLEAREPAAEGPLDALAAAVAEVRAAFLVEPSPEMAARHLAAMAAAAEDGVAVELPPRSRPVRLFTVRRAVALGVAAALTASAALASTGSLPRPAQDFVARVASHVGIDLPDAARQAGEHGKAVSEVATDPDRSGCEKARAVVEVAVPDWARSNALRALEKCGQGVGQDTAAEEPPPGGPPSAPAGGPPHEVPAGPPEGVPPGPPEGVPSGAPESVPTGGGGPGKGGPPQSVPPVTTPASSGGTGGDPGGPPES